MSWLRDRLIEETVRWGAAQEQGDPDLANLIFDARCRLLGSLRRSPEEREVLEGLLAHGSPWCRLTGATFLSPRDPARALAALQALAAAEAPWQVRIGAEQTARVISAGTLDLSFVDRYPPAEPPKSGVVA